jgi:hypothetical protein
MIKPMKTFADPLVENPHDMKTEDLIALYSQLCWHNLQCILAPAGSYEDRIESEPTANAMTDAQYELVKRAVAGDAIARHAMHTHNVDTRYFFFRRFDPTEAQNPTRADNS